MQLFIRLTLIFAAALLALVVAAFVLKLLLVAAVLAALAFGVLFVANFVRAAGRARARGRLIAR